MQFTNGQKDVMYGKAVSEGKVPKTAGEYKALVESTPEDVGTGAYYERIAQGDDGWKETRDRYLPLIEKAKKNLKVKALLRERDAAFKRFDEEDKQIASAYYDTRNGAQAQSDLARRAYNENAAAQGIGSGTSDQVNRSRADALLDELEGFVKEEAAKHAAVKEERAAVKEQYRGLIRKAEREDASIEEPADPNAEDTARVLKRIEEMNAQREAEDSGRPNGGETGAQTPVNQSAEDGKGGVKYHVAGVGWLDMGEIGDLTSKGSVVRQELPDGNVYYYAPEGKARTGIRTAVRTSEAGGSGYGVTLLSNTDGWKVVDSQIKEEDNKAVGEGITRGEVDGNDPSINADKCANVNYTDDSRNAQIYVDGVGYMTGKRLAKAIARKEVSYQDLPDGKRYYYLVGNKRGYSLGTIENEWRKLGDGKGRYEYQYKVFTGNSEKWASKTTLDEGVSDGRFRKVILADGKNYYYGLPGSGDEWISSEPMDLDGGSDAANYFMKRDAGFTKIHWNQQKVDELWQATEQINDTYGIQIDPRFLLSIVIAEGTGSFNTSSTNKAADNQNGVETNYALDLMKTNSLIIGKLLGYIYYGDAFRKAVAANNDKPGISGGGDLFQYCNWFTPIIDTSKNQTKTGMYATSNGWDANVRYLYNKLTGGQANAYEKYLSGIGRDTAKRIADSLGIKLPEYTFYADINDKDGYGNPKGLWIIKVEEIVK